MSIRFHSDRGAIVTYLHRNVDGSAVIRRAAALGPELNDPKTDDTWIPALRSDHVTTLIDPAAVIDVQPRGGDVDGHAPVPEEVVQITRRALDAVLGTLAAGGGYESAQVLLDDFVAAISPVQRTLEILADLESTGQVATAITCLVNASTQLDIGDIAAGRAAIEAAYVAFQDLSSDPD